MLDIRTSLRILVDLTAGVKLHYPWDTMKGLKLVIYSIDVNVLEVNLR